MAIIPMRNHFYKLLLRKKFEYMDLIRFSSENDILLLNNINVLNLFLIDFDTVSLKEYNEEDPKIILSLLENYKDDSAIHLSKEETLKLLEFSSKARVSYEQNKEIALTLAEYYNQFFEDDFFKYRLDILEDVCNLIEENH